MRRKVYLLAKKSVPACEETSQISIAYHAIGRVEKRLRRFPPLGERTQERERERKHKLTQACET